MLVPVLEETVGYEPRRNRAHLGANDLVVREWATVRADGVTIAATPAAAA